MEKFFLAMKLIAGIVILFRCICVAARLSKRDWAGHPLQFAGLSISYPLIGGGAVGAALDWQPAVSLLLLGMAGLVLSERRVLYHKESGR